MTTPKEGLIPMDEEDIADFELPGLPEDMPTMCPNPDCPSDGKSSAVVWVLEHIVKRVQNWNEDWEEGDDPAEAGEVEKVELVESAPGMAFCLDCNTFIDVNQELWSSLDDLEGLEDESEDSGDGSSEESD